MFCDWQLFWHQHNQRPKLVRSVTFGKGYTESLGDDGKIGQPTNNILAPPDWMEILGTYFTCPQCDRVEQGRRMVPHLNDDHKWTREEIALWVERQENNLEPAVYATAPIDLEPASEEWPEHI